MVAIAEILPRVDPASTGEAYVVEWIKAALQREQVNEPDFARLNGSDKPAIREAMSSLLLVHRQGGVEAAKKTWFDVIGKTIPEIAEIINAPRRLFHADEIEDFPPLRWLFEQEIPEGGLSVLYGQPGTAKSFKALDYAARLAMRGRPVVYIAAEGRTGYKKRLKAWRLFHKPPKIGPLYFYFDEVHLMDDARIDRFIAEVRFSRPDLIVVDTLARCMGDGDENDTRSMNRFISGCKRLQQELESAVLVLHHTVKSTDTERGSGALRGAADVMLNLREQDGVYKLINSKIKDDVAPEVQRYRLEVVEISQGETSCVLVPSNQAKIDPNHLSPNQLTVITHLAGYSFDQGARNSDLKSATELSGSSFYHALNSLADRGFIEKVGRYDPWKLTTFGKEWVVKHRIVEKR